MPRSKAPRKRSPGRRRTGGRRATEGNPLLSVAMPRAAWRTLVQELTRLPLEIARRSALAVSDQARGDPREPLTITLDLGGWGRLLSAVLPHDAGSRRISPGSDAACAVIGPIYEQLTKQQKVHESHGRR